MTASGAGSRQPARAPRPTRHASPGCGQEADAEAARTPLDAVWLTASVASAREAIFGGALDGTITSWNPGAERLFGYSAAEMLGTRVLRLAEPGRASIVRGIIAQLLDGVHVDPYRTVLVAKGGDPIEVSLSSSVVLDAKAAPMGIVVFAYDISAQRAAEGARDRLGVVVEQAIDGVLIVDAEGLVTYANAAFLAATGHTSDGLVGRPAEAVAAELLGPGGFAAVGQAAVAGMPWRGEARRTLDDGTVRHLSVTVAPTRNDVGAVTGYVVIERDVTHLREVEADLAFEATVRTVLTAALFESRATDSLADAFELICDKLATLPGVDYAGVEGFYGEDGVVILASHVPEGFTLARGTSIPPTHAAYVRERAQRGPWAEYWKALPEDGIFDTLMLDAGLKALAIGPIVHGDHVDGLLSIGTRQDAFAQALVEKMPGLVSFSTASSALLAERLHERRREVELRAAIAAVLAAAAFHPVFQPIVDLQSGNVVGYEALTRFDSGQRPDLCFGDAWSVGLGAELEIATLKASIAAAKRLPPGRWLDLNFSPRLLADPDHLGALLSPAERPMVIEITEHDLIENYATVRDAVHALGQGVRLAVDDAGVGIANFGHIIELHPDLVKLDMSLVRGVNASLGHQAMVVGMHHFSRTAGCRLIAEGIETEEEARTLADLGVEFGQGYWYGHPEPVEAWATPTSTG